MKTILLTGATGYLGTKLAKALLEKGYKLVALSLNRNEHFKYTDNKNAKIYFLSETSVEKIFNENDINMVIHTATLYGRKNEQNSDMIKANLEFPINVLMEAIKHNVETFINTDTILVKNISPYALTKSQFAQWLDFYSDKIRVINLRLDHFYGPNDKPVKFVAWLIEQFRANVEKIDLTEGSQTRDFIYIDDVIRAFLCVIENEQKIKLGQKNDFEVGTGSLTSIKELVTMLKDLMGNTTTKLNFGAVPYRKHEVLSYRVNTTALQALDWNAVVPVQEGLKKIIEIEKKGEIE